MPNTERSADSAGQQPSRPAVGGRSGSKRYWLWAVDVLAVLVMWVALSVFVSTAPFALVATLGEFGPSPCDCEELESELESVDWLGTGQGIGFRNPGIVDVVFQEEGLELEASRSSGGDYRAEAEVLVDRLSKQPGVVKAPELDDGTTLAAFRHGQVVIRVRDSGGIDVNGPEDVAVTTAVIRDLGDTMGRVPRATPPFEELLLTDYLFWAVAISSLTLMGGSLWFLIRIVGFVRRRYSTSPQ